MGYEVSFSFYEKLKDSFDYDRENLKNFKKIYGKASEEYPLDKLCQSLMQQLARRDIFIVDWEIYEFVRKKITSRMTKNDFIVKNKKFSLKNAIIEDLEEVEQDDPISNPPCKTVCDIKPFVAPAVPVPITNIMPVNIAAASNNQLVNVAVPKSDKVIKHVQFLPGRMTKPIGRFTVEKIYPVFKESMAPNGIGMMLETTDDGGARVRVPDEYFVSAHTQLFGDEEARFSNRSDSFADDKKLNWGGVINDNVPSVR